MTRSEVDNLLAAHQESFNSRDAARLARDHAEDGTFHSAAVGLASGRVAIEKVYTYWLTAFPDMSLIWDTPVVEGDRAALFWQFKGTLSGPFFGAEGSGAHVEFPGAAEYILSPQGIVSARHIFDFTGALVAARVLRVKPT